MNTHEFNKLMAYQICILQLLATEFSEQELCEIVIRHRSNWKKACFMDVPHNIVASETADYEKNLQYA